MPKNVLLLESTYFITKMIYENIKQLSDVGLRVEFTGGEGLKLIEKEKFDLLIMNMSLYDMSGLEVISKLNHADIELTVLAMSNDPDKIKSSEDPRIAGIIRLPIDFETFNEKIKGLLKI